MLYALVLAYVMRDLGMTKATAGFLYTLTLAGVGHWRRAFWLSRRPHWAQARSDAQHSDLLGVLVCFGTLDNRAYAGGVSLHPRTGDGRRVEYRGDPGRGDLAGRIARQGDCHRAEFVGDRVRAGGAGGGDCSALCQLAVRVLCWDSAGCRHALDSESRAGIGDVGSSIGGRQRQDQKLEPQGARGTQGNDSFFAIFRAPYRKSTIALLLLNFFGLFGWWGLFHVDSALSFACRSRAADAGLASWVLPRC